MAEWGHTFWIQHFKSIYNWEKIVIPYSFPINLQQPLFWHYSIVPLFLHCLLADLFIVRPVAVITTELINESNSAYLLSD